VFGVNKCIIIIIRIFLGAEPASEDELIKSTLLNLLKEGGLAVAFFKGQVLRITSDDFESIVVWQMVRLTSTGSAAICVGKAPRFTTPLNSGPKFIIQSITPSSQIVLPDKVNLRVSPVHRHITVLRALKGYQTKKVALIHLDFVIRCCQLPQNWRTFSPFSRFHFEPVASSVGARIRAHGEGLLID